MRPQMRTIDQLYEHVKTGDPETAITKTAIRRLVTTGVVSSVRIGQKYLVSVEEFEKYMSNAGVES